MSWLLPSLLPPLLRSPRPAKVSSTSDQIRSVKNRPSLIVCTFSSQRHADLGVSSCSLLNHAHAAIVFFFFFFSSFALPFPFRTVRTLRQLVPFPSIHTTPPRFSNSPTVRRRPYRHRTQLRTPVFRALPSGLNFRAASRLRSVSSSLRGLNDACAGRRLVDLCF